VKAYLADLRCRMEPNVSGWFLTQGWT
jgi:hypothetical protein